MLDICFEDGLKIDNDLKKNVVYGSSNTCYYILRCLCVIWILYERVGWCQVRACEEGGQWKLALQLYDEASASGLDMDGVRRGQFSTSNSSR
jgi:hypothetical protein